jgi:hypothetical protein
MNVVRVLSALPASVFAKMERRQGVGDELMDGEDDDVMDGEMDRGRMEGWKGVCGGALVRCVCVCAEEETIVVGRSAPGQGVCCCLPTTSLCSSSHLSTLSR